MLKSITVKNFKSFKQLTTIDLSATKYSFLKESNTYNGIVKGVMFAGQNASGKTNAIKAIKLLLDFLLKTKDVSEPMVCLFGNQSNPAELQYVFQIDDSVIDYSIKIDSNNNIVYEKLLLDEKLMMERTNQKAKTILSERNKFDENDVDKKTLFLRTLYFNTRFTRYVTLQTWWSFLENSIYVNAIEKRAGIYNEDEHVALNQYLEDQGSKKLNEFFEHFGFDQKVDYKKSRKISDKAFIESNDKTVFLKRKNIELWFPIAIESLGNQTLLNILPSILYSVDVPGMLLLDEFNSAFHNELEELLLKFFFNKSKNSQALFVSHSTNLMKTTLLRPDQIYTFMFDSDYGTKINRVSSESPRQSQNMEKMYLSGVFEGLPKYKIKQGIGAKLK